MSLAFPSRGFFGREVTIDIAGIRRGRRVVLWDDLDHYAYDWQDWTRPGDIIAVSRNGGWIRIAPFFEQWAIVAENFFREAHPRLRAKPHFHPFAFVGDALTCGDRRVLLGDIAHVEIAAIGRDVMVVVHERNVGEWMQADVPQIASFWLWIEELAARGVTIRSTLPMHLPNIPVTRDENIPNARVV
jgi:hypothetical protein